MGTAVVLIIIGGLFTLALIKTLKNRKKGGCAGCTGCQTKDACWNSDQKKRE